MLSNREKSWLLFLLQKKEEIAMDEKQKIFGYARTSTREQNEDRQIIALKEMGVPEKNIFLDKLSGNIFWAKENYFYASITP